MKKPICVLLCTLVIVGLPGVAGFINTDTLKETNVNLVDDEVPVWEVGDSWTYGVDNFSVQFYESDLSIGLGLVMDGLLIEVADATAPSYLLELSGKISGAFEYDDGAGTTIKGILLFTRVSGTAKFRQTDLAVEEAHVVIRGIALLVEHPLPIAIRIPIPMTFTLNVLQNTPRPLIDFPLFDGKEGVMAEANMSASIKLESIVLRILHLFNSEIPAEIFYEQVIDLPMLSYSANAEEVTVEAGTFSAYNIAFFEGLLGSIYYAPSAGNIVKVEAEIGVPDQFNASFIGQLKSFDYQ